MAKDLLHFCIVFWLLDHYRFVPRFQVLLHLNPRLMMSGLVTFELHVCVCDSAACVMDC